MYEVEVSLPVESAHYYRGMKGTESVLHGHSFFVSAVFRSQNVDSLGFVGLPLSFKKLLGKCVSDYDHKVLNDVFPFDSANPTLELFAERIYKLLEGALVGQELVSVYKVSVRVGDVIVSWFREYDLASLPEDRVD